MLNLGLCRSIGKFTLQEQPSSNVPCPWEDKLQPSTVGVQQDPQWGQASVGHNSNPPSYPCVNMSFIALFPPCHLIHFVSGLSEITSQGNYLNPNEDLFL